MSRVRALRDLGLQGAGRYQRRERLTARQTGLRVLESHALTALADIALESGLRAEAENAALAALAVHRETGHAQGETRALRILDLSRGARSAPRT